jgi:hypothetical protein
MIPERRFQIGDSKDSILTINGGDFCENNLLNQFTNIPPFHHLDFNYDSVTYIYLNDDWEL